MFKRNRRFFLKTSLFSALVGTSTGVMANNQPSEPVAWDESFDVVVVGSGMAGTCAAISAKQNGCKQVVVIEKMPMLGGSSAIAAGDMAAVCSTLAKKNGIKDEPALFVKDIEKLGGGFNHRELTETFANNCGRAMDFIVAHGAKFHEKLIKQNGHSVARIHQPVNGCAQGALIPLHNNFKNVMGGEFRTRVKLDALIQDKTGRVIGVKVRENYEFDPRLKSDDLENKTGTVKFYEARKGVIMGSGGYGRDVEFRKQDTPQIFPEMVLTAGLAATAGAFKAMLRIGARPVNMAFARFGLRLSATDMRYSCMVHPKTGVRCMNESVPRPVMTANALNIYKSGAKAFPIAVLDKNAIDKFDDPLRTERQAKLGYLTKHETLQDLASAYNLPFDSLKKTVDRYNQQVLNRKDLDFGKDFNLVNFQTISQAPYYASVILPVSNRGMGGVLITPKAEVLDLDGRVIPGLFAAGEAASGIHGSMSLISTTLPAAFTFGMIAGETIAK